MNLCSSDGLLWQLLEETLEGDEEASVVAHVESCETCQHRLEELTSQQALPIAAGHSVDSSTDLWLSSVSAKSSGHLLGGSAGTRLGQVLAEALGRLPRGSEKPEITGYEILAELGHGGMGVVYKARHRRLNRLVALKMIRAGSLARPEDVARFRIEAEAVARLRHPNIIQVFDVGDSGGLPFVALELLEGGDLDTRLAGTPQPARHAADLVATLARAIQAAHREGIVHRDLKPSNILFAPEGTPKITDFGLAKRLEEEGQTATGQVMGSPSYIPPEQARGQTKQVGPAADLYALGAILYEMLTGRPPFKGTSPVETVMQVLHEEPVPPSRLVSKVPRDLETICLKCLAKEPHRRYADAEALATDLEHYLANRPIRARRTPAWELALKWARRRPTTFTLAVLSVIGMLALGLGSFWHESRRKHGIGRERARAEAALVKARDELAKGWDTFDDSVVRGLSTIGDEVELADLRSQADDLLQLAASRRREQLARDVEQKRYTDFLTKVDFALFQDAHLSGLDLSGSVAAVRRAAREALQLFTLADGSEDDWTLAPLPASFTAKDRVRVIEGYYEMLMVLAEAVAQPLPGEDAHYQAQRAIAILNRADKLPHAPTRAARTRRAQYLERLGEIAAAEQARQAATAIHPDGAFDYFLTGLDQYKRGLLPEAAQQFDTALRNQPNHFWARCLLAICDLNSRPARPAEAKDCLTACLQGHDELPWVYLLRAFAYAQMGAQATIHSQADGHFDKAEADFREALQRDPEQHFRYAVLVNRGVARSQRGNLEAAREDLSEAIALSPRQHNAYAALAQVERLQHRTDDAITHLGQAIALRPDSAALYRTRVLWRMQQRDLNSATRRTILADLNEAIRLGSAGSKDLAADLARKAQVLAWNREYDETLAACDRALQIDARNPNAHRWRIAALLELRRYDEAIACCDAYLKTGRPSADLLELRGLARAKRNEFAGAIEDYTQALALQPGQATLRCRRGWAYLVSRAPELALRDFEEAVRLDPSSADALSGRGSALVALKRPQEAVRDAEESLRGEEQGTRITYNAARIFAQAASCLLAQSNGRPARLTRETIRQYQDRAVELLSETLNQTPAAERQAFWNGVVRPDEAISTLRGLAAFARLSSTYLEQSP